MPFVAKNLFKVRINEQSLTPETSALLESIRDRSESYEETGEEEDNFEIAQDEDTFDIGEK